MYSSSAIATTQGFFPKSPPNPPMGLLLPPGTKPLSLFPITPFMSGVKLGFEVVPPTSMGTPLEPIPAAFVSPPPTPPLRLATNLNERALLGLIVPAPVTVPNDGITRLILSRRVPSGA